MTFAKSIRKTGYGLIAAAALATAAMPSAPAEAADLLKVKMAIGGLNWVPYAPVMLAKQLDLFKKHGIDLELFDTRAGAQTTNAIVSGSADLGSGYFDHPITVTAKGQPIQAVILTTVMPGIALFVSPKYKNEIKEAKDLIGRPVGLTSVGGSTLFLLQYYLAKNGIAADKVPVIAVGGPDTTLVAAEQGTAHAIVNGEPAITMVEQRSGGKLTTLFDTRTAAGTKALYGADYPSSTIYGMKAWIDAHPKEVQGVVNAVLEALNYINSHSVEEITAKMPPEVVGTNKELYMAVFKNMTQIFSKDGRFTDDGVKVEAKLLAEATPALAQAKYDLSGTYTNRFVDEAHKVVK